MKKERNAEIGNEIEKSANEAAEADCEKQAEAMPSKKKEKKRGFDVRNLAFMALFTALSFVVGMIVHFPVAFLTLDLKDAVLAIGAMFCGPVSALFMSVGAVLLEFLTIGDTGPYGLIMDFISSAAFCFTAALIYKYKKSFKGAILSVLTAILVTVALMMGANMLITPYYTGLTHGQVAGYIPTLLLPFNLLKAVLNGGMVFLLYKPLTRGLSRIIPGGKEEKERPRAGKTSKKGTVIGAAVALLLIVASLLLLFFVMDAGIEFGN